MPEDDQTQRSDTPKGGSKRIVRTAAFLAAILLILPILWTICTRDSLTPQQRLAALQAERAVPDEQNAALIYNQLLEDYNEAAFDSSFINSNIRQLPLYEPWSSQDHPELAQWLKKQQPKIETLIKASRTRECRFALLVDDGYYDYRLPQIRMLRQQSGMLILAANNDIAEGQIGDALEKGVALARIGRHFRQQPTMIDLSIGVGMESDALGVIIRLIVEHTLSDQQLDLVENELSWCAGDTVVDWSLVRDVEELLDEREMNDYKFIDGLKHRVEMFKTPFLRFENQYDYAMEVVTEFRGRLLCARRATRLIIALRHYKNTEGNWPDSLEDIQTLVQPELLIDPQNNGQFAYQRTAESFRLYSKGENNLDDNGKYKFILGDTTHADDCVIWPLETTINGREDADDSQK